MYYYDNNLIYILDLTLNVGVYLSTIFLILYIYKIYRIIFTITYIIAIWMFGGFNYHCYQNYQKVEILLKELYIML